MMVSPGFAAAASAAQVASTSGEPVTQSTTTSASAAISARLATSRAPRPTRSSTASRLRWAMTRSGQPFSTAFFAIPQPIRPTPTNPTTGFSDMLRPPPLTSRRLNPARPHGSIAKFSRGRRTAAGSDQASSASMATTKPAWNRRSRIRVAASATAARAPSTTG